jgi:hypothetical protein
MKDILGTNPRIITRFELEFWSPLITNLEYEQAQKLHFHKSTNKIFCQLLPFGF